MVRHLGKTANTVGPGGNTVRSAARVELPKLKVMVTSSRPGWLGSYRCRAPGDALLGGAVPDPTPRR